MLRSFDVGTTAGGRELLLDRIASRGALRTLVMGTDMERHQAWVKAGQRVWPNLKVQHLPEAGVTDQGGFLMVDSIMGEVSPVMLTLSGEVLPTITLLGLFLAGFNAVVIDGPEWMRVWTPLPAPDKAQDRSEVQRAARAVGL